jgi:hypothetical protein
VAVLSTAYDSFFDRIPPRLLHIIVNGCTLGDRAFQQIIDSDPALLNSSYMKCLRTRIHDKALQKCLHDRIIASGIPHITVYSQDTGFGNQVATVCGDDFSLIPCHILSRGIMPAAAKYKIKACENNPGDDYGQQSLFTPPYAEKYGSITFFVTTFFDGSKTEPTLVLPDKTFSRILYSWPILSTSAFEPSEDDIAYQKRIFPTLISEVQHEQIQGAD